MSWKTVIDDDGRPLVISKSQKTLDDAVASGGTLVDSYPPRDKDDAKVKWILRNNGEWERDVARENEITQAKAERRANRVQAKQSISDLQGNVGIVQRSEFDELLAALEDLFG